MELDEVAILQREDQASGIDGDFVALLRVSRSRVGRSQGRGSRGRKSSRGSRGGRIQAKCPVSLWSVSIHNTQDEVNKGLTRRRQRMALFSE